jgi:hypothetical protein
MYALDQKVSGHDGLFSEMIDDRRIISHAQDGRSIMQFNILGQVVYQPEFAVCRNFRPFHGAKLRYVDRLSPV